MSDFNDFFEYLSESRLLARKKMDKFEKEKIYKKIKTAIKDGKISILKREKNDKFMGRKHLTEKDALNLIKEFFAPRNLLTCVENLTDMNKNTKVDDYLYIGEIFVTGYGRIYLKFQELKGNRISVVSFHESSEKMYVDFSAVDEKDTSFMDTIGSRTMETYNNHPKNENKIVGVSVKDRYTLYFEFENPITDFDHLRFALSKSLPQDMGILVGGTMRSLSVTENLCSLDFHISSYENIHGK